MTTAEEFGLAMLKADKKTKESLKENPLEFSEILLVLDDAGDFALEFDVLGQAFHLNKQGLFTFNEIGEAFTMQPEFELRIHDFLAWRLEMLRTFSI